MNYLRLIASTSKQCVAPLAVKKQARSAERKAANHAESDYQAAETIRALWLSALADDALLIGFGQPECIPTLNSGRCGMIFVMYGLLDTRGDTGTLQTLVDTVQLMQDGMNKLAGDLPHEMRVAIASGMETARIALREFKPMQILQAAHTFADRHPNLVKHGMQAEKPKCAISTRHSTHPKKHLVTFGAAIN